MSNRSNGGGAAYTRKLYFYSEVDSPRVKEYSMTNDKLIEKLGQLVDGSEMIEEVRHYTHPLNWWQLWQGNMHHAYIVFKTKNWWWSIEKNDAGITVQRSKKIEFVRDKYCKHRRQQNATTGIALKEKDEGLKTVNELIHHIYNRNYLNEDYHVLLSNCQTFAGMIYEFINGMFDIIQQPYNV